MRPNISEFSYGYAMTDELIHWHGTAITAAPLFPSLYQEGQPGGGYDVALERPGMPLFLQFKLSECMVRRNATEVKGGHFDCPFFRMHLRPRRHSNQHEMLLQLEANGNDVYYTAPAFHELDQLNEAYLQHQVRDRSLWIRPSEIGALEDDGDHHVAFQIPGPQLVCSTPRKIGGPADFASFARRVEGDLRRKGKRTSDQKDMEELADVLYRIGQQRKEISEPRKAAIREQLQKRRPIERVAFYASMFFGAQLFLVSEREP